MNAVQFEVTYEFGEYCQFAIEHGSGRGGRPFGPVGRMLISAVALPAFLFKASKVGRCSFNIGAAGIVRTSNVGELRISWTEVIAVHRYTPGLLIEKREGAVPIPYRCLTPRQRALLEGLVKDWEVAANPNAGDVQ